MKHAAKNRATPTTPATVHRANRFANRFSVALSLAWTIAVSAATGHAQTAAETLEETLAGQPVPDMSMHGPAFIGVKLDPATERPMLVHVTAFRGPHLDARMASPGASWTPTQLRATDLVGVHWVERRCADDGRCDSAVYRIVGAQRDTAANTMPRHSSNRDVWLYDVEVADVARGTGSSAGSSAGSMGTGDWRPVCEPDARGQARGLFITGDFQADGSISDSGYTFSCTVGVIAKCVRDWGYKPWQSLVSERGDTVSMRPLHRACVRAVRADYCGDGISYTRAGTMIDVFDQHGFNVREANSGFVPEAGFAPGGALWVARTRWPIGARAGDRANDRMTHLPQCIRPAAQSLTGQTAPLITVWSSPGNRAAR